METAYYSCDTVGSTNDFVKAIAARNPDGNRVIVATARFQTRGRGQRGTQWQSEYGKNLLYSASIPLPLLPPERQFDVSRKASLLISAFINGLGVQGVQVKWPNDILVNGRKIAGMLIENSLQGKRLYRSLIGVGLNVNQIGFPDLGRATSLRVEIGNEMEISSLKRNLTELLTDRFCDPLYWAVDDYEAYRDCLYGLGKVVTLTQTPVEGEPQLNTGIIRGVTRDGRLVQEMGDGQLRYYLTKEVSWNY